MENQKKKQVFYAFVVGFVCIFTYLVSYYSRNLLSVTKMSIDLYPEATITLMSSVYMFVYAIGQFVNGIIGDYIQPKKMVAIGLLLAATSTILFPWVNSTSVALICFGALGYGLSMLRGPIMKIISENMQPNHARLVTTFFMFASFAGPWIATAFTFLFDWQWVFCVAGIFTILIFFISVISLTYFEKKEIIHNTTRTTKFNFKSLLGVFSVSGFVMYFFIGGINEIVTTSITFWLTTFYGEYVGFSNELSNTIFSVVSLLKGLMPFVTLFFFRLIREKDKPLIVAGSLLATVFFLLINVVSGSWPKVICLLLAQLAMAIVSGCLWSIYIPGLGKTGYVSSINGIIDCVSYFFAAGANMIFQVVKDKLSWTSVVTLWAGIAFSATIVVLITVIIQKVSKKKNSLSDTLEEDTSSNETPIEAKEEA